MSILKKLKHRVDDNESLARIIFSPSMVYDGIIQHEAFDLCDLHDDPSQEEEDVSLVRKEIVGEITRDKYAKINPRVEGDALSGYAQLDAMACRECYIVIDDNNTITIDVLSPHATHAHASLLYFLGEGHLKGNQNRKGEIPNQTWEALTSMLAARCRYTPFPTQ